jgi:hypothetical protein
MHPGDVCEYVAGQVAELGRRIDDAPELGVTGIALERDTDLYITFHKRERPRLEATMPAGLVGPQGQEVTKTFMVVDFSQVSERELILLMECDGLDGRPPTAQLLAVDRSPLPPEQWPTDLGGGQGVIHGHRDYPRKFFCRPGLREFHTHPEHADNPWDSYREQLPLSVVAFNLLDDLQKRWPLA